MIFSSGSGWVFNQTFGKTLRGDKSRSNSFVIKTCIDLVVCPVKGLLDFVECSKLRSVDLSKGYLFRICRVWQGLGQKCELFSCL